MDILEERNNAVTELIRARQRIAALEADRGRLVVLVSEMAVAEPYPSHDYSCVFCDNDRWDSHSSDCLVIRAAALLAELEGEG